MTRSVSRQAYTRPT